MSDEPVVLINLLKVEPAKQEALIALLKQNTDTVVSTLAGWKSTRLIAARDGTSREVTLTRREVEIPQVVGHIEKVGGSKVGYVRLAGFFPGAHGELRKEVENLMVFFTLASWVPLRRDVPAVLGAMASVWEVGDPKPMVRKLTGHGLIEYVGEGRYQMHALLVQHANSLLEE